MAREDKRRNSRYARSQNVETAEYSCSLELEPRSFLIVYADVDVTWEVGDCMAVCMLGTARFWIGRLGTVHWETVDCALGDWGLCIGRLGTVHWEVRNCALGDCGLCIGRLWTVHWETGDCALGDWGLCIGRLGTVWLWIGRLGTAWLCNGSLGIGSCMTVHVAGV